MPFYSPLQTKRPPSTALKNATRNHPNTTHHQSHYRRSSTSTNYVEALQSSLSLLPPNYVEATATMLAATAVATVSDLRRPLHRHWSPKTLATLAACKRHAHLRRPYSLRLTGIGASLGPV